MNDGVEAELPGEVELLRKSAGLAFFVRGGGVAIFGQVVIIEADFPEGNDALTLRERVAVRSTTSSGASSDFAGMNSDRGPDVGEFFGELDGAGCSNRSAFRWR